MSKKKKKQQPTEKQLQIYAEAEQRRAEKVELKRRKERNSIIICMLLATIFLIISAGLTIGCIAQMRNYETNYERIEGEVSGYVIRKTPAKYNNRKYYAVISYNYYGTNYEFKDVVRWNYIPDSYVGTKVEIYVNIENPEQAINTTSADDLSIFSVVVSIFALFSYIFGMILLLQKNEKLTLKNRFLSVWLPIALFYFCAILLYWITIPNITLTNIFNRIDGCIGYAVVECFAILVALIDYLITYKRKKKINKI